MTYTTKRKRGRPTDAEKSALVKVRTTPAEKSRWTARARQSGKPLSAWLRSVINRATE